MIPHAIISTIYNDRTNLIVEIDRENYGFSKMHLNKVAFTSNTGHNFINGLHSYSGLSLILAT